MISRGVNASPRGFGVTELREPFVITLTDPTRPFVTHPTRMARYRFGLREAAWILAGRDDLAPLAEVNGQMAKYSDDGRTLWGAYGPRLSCQMEGVIAALRSDPESRQALATTWRQPTLPSKDVPCTVAWHFSIRDGRLSLTIFMRSNDVWMGLPYDVVNFTCVQQVVASILGVEVGEYHHVVSNLHLYDTNAEVATAALDPRHQRGELRGPRIHLDGFEGWSWERVNEFFSRVTDGCDYARFSRAITDVRDARAAWRIVDV